MTRQYEIKMIEWNVIGGKNVKKKNYLGLLEG